MHAVGTLPSQGSDPLGGSGFENFNKGVTAACAAAPSLGNAAPSGGDTSVSLPTTTPSGIFAPAATMTAGASTVSSAGSGGSTNHCVSGSGPDNYKGLCDFCCQYDYCPGPCTCAMASTVANPLPSSVSATGIPVPALPDSESYLGLCNFACVHGYCPSNACLPA